MLHTVCVSLRTVACVWILTCFSQVFAETDYANRFATEVAVNGQSSEEQTAAFRVAMRIILLQNSSDETLLNQVEIQRALIEADRYVDQNSYRIPGPEDKITRATPLTTTVRQSNEATHLLSVQFNPELITGLIADQSAPQTEEDPDAEPDVPTAALVWLLIDDGNGQHRIGGPTGGNVMARAKEIAGRYGLRLQFPEQDATDLGALSAIDIEAADQQRIATASSRYQEPMTVTGILERTADGSWVSSWDRYWLDTTATSNAESSSLDQALQAGIGWLATLSEQTEEVPRAQTNTGFASSSSSFGQASDENTGSVWISRLQSVEGYAAVMQLIENVDSVEYSYPQEMLPAGMLIAVSPRFALADVVQELNAVPWLRSAQTLDSGLQGPQFSTADGYYEYLR